MATIKNYSSFALMLGLAFTLLFSQDLLAKGSKKNSQTRAPVIFVHGLFVRDNVYEDIVPLKEVFNDNGYDVHVAYLNKGMSIEIRADNLYNEIKRLVPTGNFHLIGHSAGGLDSRFALWKYKDLGERCLSLTTMATPHWGSPIADDIIASVESGKFSLQGSLFGFVFGQIENSKELAYEMTTEFTHQFNAYVDNDPRVRYFSIGFFIEKPFFFHAQAMIWPDHIKMLNWGYELNDGPVPLESSRWGEVLEPMAADHFAETSQIKYNNKEVFRDIFANILQNLDKNFN